jgi:hypothetical protein
VFIDLPVLNQKDNFVVNNTALMTEFDNIVPDDVFVDESEIEIVGFEAYDECELMVGVEETSSIIDEQILCFDMDSDIDGDITLEI